jgi:hypothetical protein
MGEGQIRELVALVGAGALPRRTFVGKMIVLDVAALGERPALCVSKLFLRLRP